MKATLLTGHVWGEIKDVAKNARTKSFVAVAYFGNNGARMLPIKAGSVLVVDASELAVKTGQTNPSELLNLHIKGVRIYSYAGLHAKVFVLGTRVFIGSANVSVHSENYLHEAAYYTSDRDIVRQSKEFVEGICKLELGPEKLEQLVAIYRPPKNMKRVAKREKMQVSNAECLYVTKLSLIGFSPGFEEPLRKATEKARKKKQHSKRFRLTYIQFDRKPIFELGKYLVQVLKDGQKIFVAPPAQVLSIEKWKTENKFIICVEEPITGLKELHRLTAEAQKLLKRGGKKSLETSLKIADLWN